MKAGYTVEYNNWYDYKDNIIECCNFKGTNQVVFYSWDDKIGGTTYSTVAIFKIKPKK